MIVLDFKRAFVRKLGYMAAAALVAVVLSLVGTGKAQAHTTGCLGGLAGGTCDKGVAFEQAKMQSNAVAHCVGVWPTVTGIIAEIVSTLPTQGAGETGYYTTKINCRHPSNNAIITNGATDLYYWVSSCTSRNASLGGASQPMKYASSAAPQCIAGCRYSISSNNETKTIFANAAGQPAVQTGTLYGGLWEYTGDTCSDVPMKPRDEEKPKTNCTPVSAGQTYCLTDDNKQCHTASTGRTICWTQAETGEKTDGAVTQTKTNGIQPPGTIDGSTHTSTTNITTTTTTTTNNTTINNHTTNSGGPAGPTNSGTGTGSNGGPSGGTGSGSGTGGDGDDEEGDNESTGGGTCDAPPVSSGDQILGQIAIQTWHTRCNTKKGELAGDGSCSSDGTVVGFACTGDQVQCAQVLRTRELACKAERNRQDWTGDGGTGDSEEDLETVWADGDDAPNLDAGGFGWGRSCPQLPQVFGRSIQHPFLCDSLALIGTLVLLLAYFHAAKIVAR